jgi:hypothetical protein
MMIAIATTAEMAHVDIARIRILAIGIRVALVEIGGRPYNCQKAIRMADRREMMSTTFDGFEHFVSERGVWVFEFWRQRHESKDCAARWIDQMERMRA